MVAAYDFLDSMMYSIVASGVLMGVTFLRLPYKASTDSFGEDNKSLRKGLGFAIGLNGLYLSILGIAHFFLWPYAMSGGAYNLLFGGAAAFGGLVLIAISAALFMNGGVRAVSYFAAVLGVYLAVYANAIRSYNLTSNAMLSTLLYLAPAATAFLSVPATHVDNKYVKWVFAIFAFLYAAGWGYFAMNVSMSHLKPPGI